MTAPEWDDTNYLHSTLAPRTVDFVSAVKGAFSKYATFKGRASRSEYWYLVLFYFVLYGIAVFMAIFESTGTGVSIVVVVWLVFVIPGISTLVRRLHDTDRSGFWYWISLIPFGGIAVLFFLCQPGTPGENEFGPAQ